MSADETHWVTDGICRGRNENAMHWSMLIGSDFLDHFIRFLALYRSEDRDFWFDNSGCFAGNFGEGVAEPFFVIELDVGNDTGERGDDVGGVEAATEAGFPNH